MRSADDLEGRKQLLVAQAEFDRLKLAMAWHDVRRLVRPTLDASQPASRSVASRALGFVLPLVGAGRAGSVIHALSVALSVYRFLRGFARG